jgi:putative ABC transport system ATP-binding protein
MGSDTSCSIARRGGVDSRAEVDSRQARVDRSQRDADGPAPSDTARRSRRDQAGPCGAERRDVIVRVRRQVRHPGAIRHRQDHLNRLEDPTAGGLWFHGTSYAQLSAITLRRRVAMVFQVPVIFPGSVRDNLCAALRLRHRDGEIDPADLTRALELAGLDGAMLLRDAAALSTGEKQRACIARALMTRPEVLLLDEPTAALDPTAARRLIESVVHLSRTGGLTVIMVSHQPEHARGFGGQAILLVGGRVVEQTSAEQFFVAPATDQGRSYLDRTLSGVAS